MKLCSARFILAAAIVVLAIFWWPLMWAKWVIVAAGAILAVMAIFYQACCCRDMGKTEEGKEKPKHRTRAALILLLPGVEVCPFLEVGGGP